MSSPPEIWSLAWWDEIAPLVQAAVVLVTGFVAVRGLSAWERQMIGKRKAELAEQVLVSFYDARDVFQFVRTNALREGEGKTRQPDKGETEQIQKMRNMYFVPIERLIREKELFAKLRAQRYAFRSYFGAKSNAPFETLAQAHSKLQFTASSLINISAFDATDKVVADQRSDLLNTLGWGTGARPDDLDKSIDAAVSEIEALCKPILEGKH